MGTPDVLLTVTETVARPSMTTTEAGVTVVMTVAAAFSTAGADVTVRETEVSADLVAASP